MASGNGAATSGVGDRATGPSPLPTRSFRPGSSSVAPTAAFGRRPARGAIRREPRCQSFRSSPSRTSTPPRSSTRSARPKARRPRKPPSRPQRPSKKKHRPSRSAVAPPLDVASDTRLLIRCGSSPGGDGLDGRSEIAPCHRLSVARPAVVELTAIGELAGAVEGVEIRRARGVERSGDALRFVEQKRESPRFVAGEPSHGSGPILWIGLAIVRVDGHDGKPPIERFVRRPDELGSNVHDERAVVADEQDERSALAGGERTEVYLGPVDRVGQPDEGKGSAERKHAGGCGGHDLLSSVCRKRVLTSLLGCRARQSRGCAIFARGTLAERTTLPAECGTTRVWRNQSSSWVRSCRSNRATCPGATARTG